MRLTKKEKQILTLADDAKVAGFEEFVQKFVNIPKSEVQKIIIKLKKLKLINIAALADENDLYYFHDGENFKLGMLDDDLRYKRDYGKQNPLTFFKK